MTDSTMPQSWPYATAATIRLEELLAELRTHTPVGRTEKPALPIDSADARTRALIEVMRRPTGCARSTVDALVLRKVNLARMLRPYHLDVFVTISIETGARYIAVPTGMRPGVAFGEFGNGCWQL